MNHQIVEDVKLATDLRLRQLAQERVIVPALIAIYAREEQERRKQHAEVCEKVNRDK